MYPLGYNEQHKTTCKIESTDEGLTAEQTARGLFNDVDDDNLKLQDFVQVVERAKRKRIHNALDFATLVGYYFCFSSVFIRLALDRPIWRRSIDSWITVYLEELHAYLTQNGSFRVIADPSLAAS